MYKVLSYSLTRKYSHCVFYGVVIHQLYIEYVNNRVVQVKGLIFGRPHTRLYKVHNTLKIDPTYIIFVFNKYLVGKIAI